MNSRSKGARGERELTEWLRKHTGIETSRKLGQARDGGADIVDFPGLIIEVKRREVLELDKWWAQVLAAAEKESGIPVVAYRKNKQRWSFCIPLSELLADAVGFITLRENEFLQWIETKMRFPN